MKNLFAKLFRNEEQEQDLDTPIHIKAVFKLMYENLEVGELVYEDGMWTFGYSEAFKNQEELDVLIDFPQKNKKYQEAFLWPFFAHRIPGLGQPQVRYIIEHENIDPHNEVDLLKRFGKKSIANPFELGVA
jgi:HipA-like protein